MLVSMLIELEGLGHGGLVLDSSLLDVDAGVASTAWGVDPVASRVGPVFLS